MSLAFVMTAAASFFAVAGIAGMFLGTLAADPAQRVRRLRAGSLGMMLAGLILMIGGILNIGGKDALFGGFLMMLFGSGVSIAPKKSGPPDEAAQ